MTPSQDFFATDKPPTIVDPNNGDSTSVSKDFFQTESTATPHVSVGGKGASDAAQNVANDPSALDYEANAIVAHQNDPTDYIGGAETLLGNLGTGIKNLAVEGVAAVPRVLAGAGQAMEAADALVANRITGTDYDPTGTIQSTRDKNALEAIAGLESAGVGIADTGIKAFRHVKDFVAGNPDLQTVKDRLLSDAGTIKEQRNLSQGILNDPNSSLAPVNEALNTYANVPIDPNAVLAEGQGIDPKNIQAYGLAGNPLNIVPVEAALGRVGGLVEKLPGAAPVFMAAETAGNALKTATGIGLENAGNAIQYGAAAAQRVASAGLQTPTGNIVAKGIAAAPVVGSVLSGHLSSLFGTGYASGRIARGLNALRDSTYGQAIQNGIDIANGVTPTFANVTERYPVKLAVPPSLQLIAGNAVRGGLSAVPYALGADSPEQAGQIIGGGMGLGALAGGTRLKSPEVQSPAPSVEAPPVDAPLHIPTPGEVEVSSTNAPADYHDSIYDKFWKVNQETTTEDHVKNRERTTKYPTQASPYEDIGQAATDVAAAINKDPNVTSNDLDEVVANAFYGNPKSREFYRSLSTDEKSALTDSLVDHPKETTDLLTTHPDDLAAQKEQAKEAPHQLEVVNPSAPTVPESPATLQEQQKALIEGRQKAQMFPNGTTELPLPDGMGRVETDSGVFHYNPDQIGEAEIKAAVEAGNENQILNLGPANKAQVGTENLSNIVERTPDGTEVKAGVVNPETAPETAKTIADHAAAGNTVEQEPLDVTLAKRVIIPAEQPKGHGGPIADPDAMKLRPNRLLDVNGQTVLTGLGVTKAGQVEKYLAQAKAGNYFRKWKGETYPVVQLDPQGKPALDPQGKMIPIDKDGAPIVPGVYTDAKLVGKRLDLPPTDPGAPVAQSLNKALKSKDVLHVIYDSAGETTPNLVEGRQAEPGALERRQAQAMRDKDATFSQLAHKAIIPDSFSADVDGSNTKVSGYSPDKLYGNMQQVFDWAKANGRTTAYDGASPQEIAKDLSARNELHANGYTGLGEPIKYTPELKAAAAKGQMSGLPKEANPAFAAKAKQIALTPAKLDFLNLVEGPSVFKPTGEGKAASKLIQNILEDKFAEANPARANELRNAIDPTVLRKIEGTYETLRLDRIKKIVDVSDRDLPAAIRAHTQRQIAAPFTGRHHSVLSSLGH